MRYSFPVREDIALATLSFLTVSRTRLDLHFAGLLARGQGKGRVPVYMLSSDTLTPGRIIERLRSLAGEGANGMQANGLMLAEVIEAWEMMEAEDASPSTLSHVAGA